MCVSSYELFKSTGLRFVANGEAPVCDKETYDGILRFVQDMKENWKTDRIFEAQHGVGREKEITDFLNMFEDAIKVAKENAETVSSFHNLFSIEPIKKDKTKSYLDERQKFKYKMNIEFLIHYPEGQLKKDIDAVMINIPKDERAGFADNFLMNLRNLFTEDENERLSSGGIQEKIEYAVKLHDAYEKAINDIEDKRAEYVVNENFRKAYNNIPKDANEECR